MYVHVAQGNYLTLPNIVQSNCCHVTYFDEPYNLLYNVVNLFKQPKQYTYMHA